ncbi:hypothetical protein M8J75_010219 [Diaphorina citri]|nr:hypothetical protein M8J75_010219 [Diaphorina citri]
MIASSKHSSDGRGGSEVKKEKREKREKKSVQRYSMDKAGTMGKSVIVMDSKEKEASSKSSSHATNGDQMEHMRETRSEKHHYAREKSNDDRFSFERESGRHEHERSEKHSRRTGDKRR